jgi:membrane fusion protein, multidrug efflux system
MSVTAPPTAPPQPDGTPRPPAERVTGAAAGDTVAASEPMTAPGETAPPLPAAALKAPRPPREASRLRRLLLVGGTILGLFIVYQVFVYFVAYTDDAYVRSDLVAVASEVTGPILEVHVVDNQDVKKGDRLFTIDPKPFQLIVNQRQAEIDEQKALLKVSREELSSARASLSASTSAHTYAQEQQARYSDLAKSEYAPRAELDKANDDLRRTAAEMRISEFAIEKAQNGIVAHQAALNLATAEMATAQWRLGKTRVVSPTDGAITNLTVRPGDTANANVPIIGIVDAHAWRIMANYKQDYIRSFKIGDTVWVWLDSEPFQFHRARIQGIARGFSREVGETKLLPYVAPTTDWIRLQRRIPVTITLVDPPPGLKLYMGADARTVIFP